MGLDANGAGAALRNRRHGPASARTTLAESQLAQGKLADARRSIDVASQLAAKSNERTTLLSARRIDARVRAASGEITEAEKSLQAILDEATKLHLIDDVFKARLALGEIELKSRKTAAGRARLAGLEKDATAKGFLLIARKAHAAE